MANRIARFLRHTPTVSERRLWQELRKLRRQGYHFRRQVPIDNYIVDFACLTHRLVIEVHGSQHDTPEGLGDDSRRDSHLRWQGFTIVRFRNSDVRQNIDGVLTEILAALGAVVKQE